jgi:hypothetical protein
MILCNFVYLCVRSFPGAHMSLFCILFLSLKMGVTPPRVAYSIRVPRHSTRVTAIFDQPSVKSSWAPLDSHIHCLDSVNTVTPMYTCACRCPRYQPPRLVTRHPGLSVQASYPSFTAPGLSAQHVPTWPSPRRRPPPPSSTPIHHKPRDMSHNPTHAMVSHKLNLGCGSRWQSLITKMNYKSTYQPCIRNLPLDKCIVNTNTRTAWAKERRRRENKELTQMTKSQRKAKTGSFEMSKTWSPKT